MEGLVPKSDSLKGQRENVVRATGARWMRRRPASAASTFSAAATLEDLDTVDGSDKEGPAGEYYNAHASRRKEKKRQEREAQRQCSSPSEYTVVANCSIVVPRRKLPKGLFALQVCSTIFSWSCERVENTCVGSLTLYDYCADLLS
ncbi:hypothetical protein LguiA_023250 [Lonicera macranthoides]